MGKLESKRNTNGQGALPWLLPIKPRTVPDKGTVLGFMGLWYGNTLQDGTLQLPVRTITEAKMSIIKGNRLVKKNG
ncbi:hypothetical protein WQ57_04325 [Mesobacillus campisalis]|uniref:Uncharacterized protein n=1 Tax=Mesobacillus campisalis TaxID=1408103 RepID=A0A0M2T2H9_9BACI|nr:hypothetical protein WQ57_04325 [Mesobacillus campisalis]